MSNNLLADSNLANACLENGNVTKGNVENSILPAALPPICAASSDASTVLMENDNDTAWSGTGSDVVGTNPGPESERTKAMGCATPAVATEPGQEYTSSFHPFPVESPAPDLFNSPGEGGSSEFGAMALAAIESTKPCDPAEEFAPCAERANEDVEGTTKNDQHVDAGVDLPVNQVETLNPFEEEPLNPFDEEPLNPFESVGDGAELSIRDDVPEEDDVREHLQTKGACGSPLNPFDSPMTFCAITTGIALPSAESSPEAIADTPDSCNMYESVDPLNISNIPHPNDTPKNQLPKLESSSSNSLTPLRRRASEAIPLEDSLVFPSLQDTMASLQRSATPSKAHSMNLPSPPRHMEYTKKTDNNADTSGMCSAPATVANIPLLLLTESECPPEIQAELPPPLKASSSSSWEGFDIIDAAQMELASIIKETRCKKTKSTSYENADHACF